MCHAQISGPIRHRCRSVSSRDCLRRHRWVHTLSLSLSWCRHVYRHSFFFTTKVHLLSPGALVYLRKIIVQILPSSNSISLCVFLYNCVHWNLISFGFVVLQFRKQIAKEYYRNWPIFGKLRRKNIGGNGLGWVGFYGYNLTHIWPVHIQAV